MIKDIGGITLDPPVWWDEYSTSDFFIEENVDTIDGGIVTYRYSKKDKYITLSTGTEQRQTSTVKDAIIALSRVDAPTTITTFDDTVVPVEFVHQNGSAVIAQSLVDARLSNIWAITIALRTY